MHLVLPKLLQSAVHITYFCARFWYTYNICIFWICPNMFDVLNFSILLCSMIKGFINSFFCVYVCTDMSGQVSLMSDATLQISCVYLNTFQRGVLTPMIECTLSTITQRQHSGKTLEPKGEWQKNTTDKLCQCGLLGANH